MMMESMKPLPPIVVEKVSVNDTTAIQMLSELQNILGTQETDFEQDQKRDKKCTTDLTHENQSSSNDETTVQMINELQNILEKQKNILSRVFDVDSDELNRLLEELAKVTCAPILAWSYQQPYQENLTDEEEALMV
ncbi:hypothetical protein NQ318_010890 [Aromia moschata]|uniref:Uncharacterized protein n=1 Tax=Aromia moschata TaxID=1265417 RepID=A0AAV8XJV4_9CUCU|nr:hypothetical protein NQ318_010890 [Aromia moschata]